MGKKKMPPCVSDISVFDTKTFHVECLENQGKITMFVFITKKKKRLGQTAVVLLNQFSLIVML